MNRYAQHLRRDVVGLIATAIFLFLTFSLLSYNPNDPSFNRVGDSDAVANWCGLAGSYFADLLVQVLGLAAWALIPTTGVLVWRVYGPKKEDVDSTKLMLITVLILSVSGLLELHFRGVTFFQNQIPVGGLIGLGVKKTLYPLLNSLGLGLALWLMVGVTMVLLFEKTFGDLVAHAIKAVTMAMAKAKNKLAQKPKVDKANSQKGPIAIGFTVAEQPRETVVKNQRGEVSQEQPLSSEPEVPLAVEVVKRRVTLKARVPGRVENWALPKLSLIEDPPATRIRIDEKEIRKKSETLLSKLSLFGVTGEVVAAKPGPAVTMFEFRPMSSVKLSKITELEDDLSLALSSESLRILAPIPGRDVVGIETSNTQRETVYLKDMLAEDKFWSEDIKLPIALGRSVDGTPEIVDLRKMPHLMVAGTTGSGKSVFTVSAITGLIYKHSPKTLRLILIDPKQVDLAVFENIPHLTVPVVTDSRQAVQSLKWAVAEMEKRYRSMSQFSTRKIEEFNAAVAELTREQVEEHQKINEELETTPGKKNETYYFQQLPFLVIVVEEFADLMTVDKGNVEQSVIRLAQKARACGIHLLLCLQSPRKEFVTGAIKSNIPGRIAFKVASSMESRIILDDTGAERLLATGDMLYRGPGSSAIIRHHGPFLKDQDIQAVTKFWADQAPPVFDVGAMAMCEGSEDAGGNTEFGGDAEVDDRYDEILQWVQTQKEVSASLIQRRFQLGYPRAARLIEYMEREQVVGPANGSKPRAVLINDLSHH